jgi:hypothetical protein
MSGNLGVEVSLILWLADHRTKRDILYFDFSVPSFGFPNFTYFMCLVTWSDALQSSGTTGSGCALSRLMPFSIWSSQASARAFSHKNSIIVKKNDIGNPSELYLRIKYQPVLLLQGP